MSQEKSLVTRILDKNAIPIFLVAGAFSTTLGKVCYSMEAKGNKNTIHEFAKPWFTDWAMFLGMLLLMIPYLIKKWYVVYVKKEEPEEVSKKLYWVIAIPAALDLISTFMMNVGLLWIFPSIWQMLRGSIVIFTAILTVTYRKKRLYSSGWSGVFIVALALCIVALSALLPETISGASDASSSVLDSLSSEFGDGKSESTEVIEMIVGIILVILAQFMQALQTIIEEKLLHDIKAPEILIVGMEGVWGFVLCSCIAMPIAYFLPGEEGNGIHEDTIDSFYMVVQNGSLFGLLVGYVFSILLFNYFGMVITATTSAMIRNLMEPFRTLFIWVVDIFIYYVISKEFGEELNYWSFLELGGFIVLTFGFFIFNGVIKLPFLTYAQKEEDGEKQPLIVNDNEE